MKHTWIVTTICLALLGASFATPGQAEDWSLRKINPFGQKETDKPARGKERSSWLPTIAVPRVPQPLTAVGVKKNFAKISHSTQSAISSTTEALAPQNLIPQIQLPSLTRRAASDEKSAVASDSKSSSGISLVQWFSPAKDAADERAKRDAEPANSWFGQNPPKP